MYYVYLWLREDRTPYYVGKGKEYRAYVKHLIGNPPPRDRIVIVETFDDEEESYKYEEYLIEVYGRKCEGGILLNTSVGGRKRNSRYRETEEEFKERRKDIVKKYQQSEKGRETYNRWVTENKERVKEIKKKYRDKNKEKLNENARNSERKKAADKIYRDNNKDRIAETQREYQQKNKEKLREYHREYYHRRKKLDSKLKDCYNTYS